jgi:L-rhamnose isomerase/sugar isomerase
MDARQSEKIFNALETFRIELPSWGFANTGTRFGKFIQPAAATSTKKNSATPARFICSPACARR